MKADKKPGRDIENFLPLVRLIARILRHRLPSNVEYDDLFQDGCIGLMEALRTYRPGKGSELRGWATLRIRGAMLDGLRERADISREQIKKQKRLRVTCQNLAQRLGRGPDDDEMARSLGIKLGHFHKMLQMVDDLPERILTARRNERWEFLNGPMEGSADPFKYCLRREKLQLLAHSCRRLGLRDRQIIYWYSEFGFTQKEIAEALGLDESSISLRFRHAISRLRESISATDQASN